MSILYCAVPHFATSLARRDHPELAERPLVLLDPEERVFDASAEAAVRGVVVGLPAKTVRVRCPEAHLQDADIARCRQELEALFQILEQVGPSVEPHSWGSAYVDLGDAIRDRDEAIALCQESGRTVRQALGQALQPALGWDTGKFTAHAAARHTRPGRLLAVDAADEHDFLHPLSIKLLPLSEDVLQRLCFLGLRTLGQYAALPIAAVWQQFGRAGKHAYRLARGEDDRPVVPRWKLPVLTASHEFEEPVFERERLITGIEHLLIPLLSGLSENLQACGQLRLVVRFDNGVVVEKTRTFLFPNADQGLFVHASDDLLGRFHWLAPAVALSISLEQIQDAVLEQLALFEDERKRKLCEVQRYLAARFGANRLRRAVLVQPGAPLPEWRAVWQSEE